MAQDSVAVKRLREAFSDARFFRIAAASQPERSHIEKRSPGDATEWAPPDKKGRKVCAPRFPVDADSSGFSAGVRGNSKEAAGGGGILSTLARRAL